MAPELELGVVLGTSKHWAGCLLEQPRGPAIVLLRALTTTAVHGAEVELGAGQPLTGCLPRHPQGLAKAPLYLYTLALVVNDAEVLTGRRHALNAAF
jgi:hypothetical protein